MQDIFPDEIGDPAEMISAILYMTVPEMHMAS